MKTMIVAVLLTSFLCGNLIAGNKTIQEEDSWNGVIPNSLKADLPKGSIITDKASFTKIWSKWAKGKSQPKVDFAKYMVYVHTYDANDPNRQRTSFMVKDGTLRALTMSTRMGFSRNGKKSKYVMSRIPKAGIKRIEGHEIVNGKFKKVVTPIAKN